MNRREFLTAAGAVALAGCVSTKDEKPRVVSSEGVDAVASATPKVPRALNLGIAGYSFVDLSLDQSLDNLKFMDVHGFCAKSFHYPYEASAEQLKALVRKTTDAGVTLYGAGPISFNSPDEARKYFDYAAALGVPTIVGVPGEKAVVKGKSITRSSRKMCEICSKLADEYKMNFAIHNHGANPKTGNPNLYPTAVSTMELIRDLSPRMGLCLDIAYTYADGFDPAEIIRRFKTRIFDCHLRNIGDPTNGSAGVCAHMGVIDYKSVFKVLKEINYTGWCGLEMTFMKSRGKKHTYPGLPDPDPFWVPQSLGYFRALMEVA